MKCLRHNGRPAIVVLILLAGACGGLASAAAQVQLELAAGCNGAALPSFSLAGLGDALVVSLEAAVGEELLFRGPLLWGLAAMIPWLARKNMPLARVLVRRWGPQGAAVFAVAVSALLFGIAHLLPSPETPLPALSPAVAVQAMLKVVEGTAFGSLMGSLVVNSRWFAARDGAILRSLGFPMLLHAAFDLLYFAPTLGLGLPLPDTYLTGNVLDELGMAASTLLLILAVFVAARSKKARSC